MSSDRFACIEYNITNSSWHFGSNGSYGPVCHPQNSIWTSASLRSEENIILIGPGQYAKVFNGQYTKILTGCANKDK
jgi:hypothetical protein